MERKNADEWIWTDAEWSVLSAVDRKCYFIIATFDQCRWKGNQIGRSLGSLWSGLRFPFHLWQMGGLQAEHVKRPPVLTMHTLLPSPGSLSFCLLLRAHTHTHSADPPAFLLTVKGDWQITFYQALNANLSKISMLQLYPADSVVCVWLGLLFFFVNACE